MPPFSQVIKKKGPSSVSKGGTSRWGTNKKKRKNPQAIDLFRSCQSVGPLCVRGGARAAVEAEIQARTDLKTSVSGLVLKAKI